MVLQFADGVALWPHAKFFQPAQAHPRLQVNGVVAPLAASRELMSRRAISISALYDNRAKLSGAPLAVFFLQMLLNTVS